MELRSINGLLKPTENWIKENNEGSSEEDNESEGLEKKIDLDTVYLGHYVIVSYLQIFKTGANTQANVFGKDRIDVEENGEFRFFLPEKEFIYEQNVTLEVYAPDGEFLGKVRTSYGSLHDSKASVSQKDTTASYDIEINPKTVKLEEPSEKTKFYKKISGKLIDSSAQTDTTGLQIIIMATGLEEVVEDVEEGGEANNQTKAVLSAQLDSSGYFYSQLEMHTKYTDAYAYVAGLNDTVIPISLEDGELPKNIILVADLSELTEEDIKKSIASLPDSSDLVNSSDSSQDLGGTCVDFTVPNKSLEEHNFFHTVRTTEPEIRSYTIGKNESREFKNSLSLHTSNAFTMFRHLIDSWNSIGLYYYEESVTDKKMQEKESSAVEMKESSSTSNDVKMMAASEIGTSFPNANRKFSYSKQLTYLSSSLSVTSLPVIHEYDFGYLDKIIDARTTYRVNEKKLEQLHKKVQEAYCLKNININNTGYCENINLDTNDETDDEVIDSVPVDTSKKEINYIVLKQDINKLLENIKSNKYVRKLEDGIFYKELQDFLKKLGKLNDIKSNLIGELDEKINKFIKRLKAGLAQPREEKDDVINYLAHIIENINAGRDVGRAVLPDRIVADRRDLAKIIKRVNSSNSDNEVCVDDKKSVTGIICLMKDYEKLKDTLANKAIFTLGEIMEIGAFYNEFELSIKYFSSLLEDFYTFYKKCNTAALFMQDDYFVKNYSNIKAELKQLKLSIRLATNKIDKIELEYINNHPGRRNLSVDTSIDWDETPTVYENTTIAHGHILQFKQVWKADGYSLGDLLYSLPLAPCQEKQIAIVDWDRREEAGRTEEQSVSESLSANLSRDRDISEIVNSTFNENVSARSSNKTSSTSGGGSGGLGFSIGGFTLGASGGVSHSGSSSVSNSSQSSARNLSGNTLNRLQENVSQSASSLRSQRNTVVQAVGQNESVSVQTEVIKNNNHCHAMTVEYFEVLKHYAVEQELVDAQECLFVPLPMSDFDHQKVLRWKNTLKGAMYGKELIKGFDAVERIESSRDTGLPAGRYADDVIQELSGYFTVSFDLERPYISEIEEKTETKIVTKSIRLDGFFPWVGDKTLSYSYFVDKPISEKQKDNIFERDYAPYIIEKFIDKMGLYCIDKDGNEKKIDVDVTLMSSYHKGNPLRVNVALKGESSITRADIKHLLFRAHTAVTPSSKILLRSAYIHYRTDYMSEYLLRNGRINNDIISTKQLSGISFSFTKGSDYHYKYVTDAALVYTPLSKKELVNPKEEDRQAAENLLSFLNEHLEMAHKAIWSNIDSSRLFGLLDGYIAPNAKGRSVASVVENKVMGIVGNNLVLKVVPGEQLDPMLRGEDLLEHYKPDIKPDPFRISVPTKGVYAESVMGKCNACEEIDETRHWRYEDAPCGTTPTAIDSVSTSSRRAEIDNLQVKDLPTNIINMQTPQAAPDPSGLLAAYGLLGKSDTFKDMTGLQGTQANAIGALQTTSKSVTDLASISKDFANLAVMASQKKSAPRQISELKKLKKEGTLSAQEYNEKVKAVVDTPINAAKSLSMPYNATDAGVTKVAQDQAKVALSANKNGANVELEHTSPDGSQTKTKISQPENRALNISNISDIANAINQGSQKDEAQAVIDAFGSRGSELKFNVTRSDIVDGLTTLVNNPNGLKQGKLNVCGPSSVLRSVLHRDPKFIVNFVTDLVEKGKANFGPRVVDPSSDLKEQEYKQAWIIDAATWVAASSLRDDENWWFDYEGTPEENASAITLPGEIKDWLNETGLYSSVEDEVNLALNKDVSHALSLDIDDSIDNILLINANLLDSSADSSILDFVQDAFPSHYVVLTSKVISSSGNVSFDVWTYGNNEVSINVPISIFEDNYYGAVIAKV